VWALYRLWRRRRVVAGTGVIELGCLESVYVGREGQPRLRPLYLSAYMYIWPTCSVCYYIRDTAWLSCVPLCLC
jgi:hypothetical protein